MNGNTQDTQRGAGDAGRQSSGELFAGSYLSGPDFKYELLRLLGQGSQGRVFKARCAEAHFPGSQPGGIVAVKLLGRIEPAAHARVERAIEALLGFSHPNLVRYMGSFVWHGEWDEARGLVMEFLEGDTLQRRLDESPEGLPWDEVRPIFEQAIRGLEYARERGVVHRDLKPSNIFLTAGGGVKIIDFDVARQERATTSSSGGWVGSFDYMAPEFARDESFHGDEISDIFSLAACFYHALTGKPPFPALTGNAGVGFLRRWGGEEPVSPSFQPSVFRVLEKEAREFVRRGLSPDRGLRFRNYGEAAEALGAIRRRRITGKDEYELTAAIGRGGFGEVFKARRTGEDTPLAVKWLFSEHQPRRFVKEARLLERLCHEHLVRYVDFVETAGMGGKTHYFLVLEYLEGMPAACLRNRIIAANRGLTPEETLELFEHYLEALEYLHARGIVHRDIKPANLYAPEGNPGAARIFDLGIARDISGTVTTGYVPGTLEYMPPELARGESDRGSPRTDIFSLGQCMYEALTGRAAFKPLPDDQNGAVREFLRRAEDATESADFGVHPFPRHPELARIVRKAMARKPSGRYASAAAMKADIVRAKAALSKHGEAETPAREQPSFTATTPAGGIALGPRTDASGSRAPEERLTGAAPAGAGRRPFLLAAACVAAVLAAALAATFFLRRADGRKSVPGTTSGETPSEAVPPEASGRPETAPAPSETPPQAESPETIAAADEPADEPAVARKPVRAEAVIAIAPAETGEATVPPPPPPAPAPTPSEAVARAEAEKASGLEARAEPAMIASVRAPAPPLPAPRPPEESGARKAILVVAPERTADSPVVVEYRQTGTTEWREIAAVAGRLEIAPGEIEFRFTRADYEGQTLRARAAAGTELKAAPPAEWQAGPSLARLLELRGEMSREEVAPPAVERILAGPRPAFDWPAHFREYAALEQRWPGMKRQLAEAAAARVLDSIEDCVRWLYQAADPAVGSYRRHTGPPPAPAGAASIAAETAGGDAGTERVRLWLKSSSRLDRADGRKSLAAALRNLAAAAKEARPDLARRCEFEAAVLLSEPGRFDPSFRMSGAPPEANLWKAHALYMPRSASSEVLEDLLKCVEMKGRMNSFDVRLALYEAGWCWMNSAEGEGEYARKTGRLLGGILAGLDEAAAAGAVASVAETALRDRDRQNRQTALYLVEAVSLMPATGAAGAAKRAATDWLAAHGSDRGVADDRNADRDRIELLKRLLSSSP